MFFLQSSSQAAVEHLPRSLLVCNASQGIEQSIEMAYHNHSVVDQPQRRKQFRSRRRTQSAKEEHHGKKSLDPDPERKGWSNSFFFLRRRSASYNKLKECLNTLTVQLCLVLEGNAFLFFLMYKSVMHELPPKKGASSIPEERSSDHTLHRHHPKKRSLGLPRTVQKKDFKE